ncbi:MAG TPA: hypothetical protein PKE66_06695, partial [Pyrinomonadaceae bacterium]|nr:hypothetical protein [Pyrinomonadaceae bacterium]
MIKPMKDRTIICHSIAAFAIFFTFLISPCLFATSAAGQTTRPRPPRPPRVEGQTPIGTMNGQPVTANDLITTINTDSPFMPPLDGSSVPILNDYEKNYPGTPQSSPTPIDATQPTA